MITCGPGKEDPRFPPDETLRTELGLTDADEVHRVSLVGGEAEVVEPMEVAIPRGVWVEFVTTDWRVHEVHFEVDSLDPASRSYLTESDQVASPPLVDRDSRFVVRFDSTAPAGRYPFVVLGNGVPGRGVVIIRPKP